MTQQTNLSNERLTNEEVKELRELLGRTGKISNAGKSIDNLDKMLKMHNHDNQNSVYVKTLNIDDSVGKVIDIDAEKVSFGLGVRLKNNADGLPNLGDGDLGTIFYNTTYDEMWIWRKDGGSNSWKALEYAGGYILPESSADADAPNNSIYYSTDASKLVYKDSGGTPNNLY